MSSCMLLHIISHELPLTKPFTVYWNALTSQNLELYARFFITKIHSRQGKYFEIILIAEIKLLDNGLVSKGDRLCVRKFSETTVDDSICMCTDPSSEFNWLKWSSQNLISVQNHMSLKNFNFYFNSLQRWNSIWLKKSSGGSSMADCIPSNNRRWIWLPLALIGHTRRGKRQI